MPAIILRPNRERKVYRLKCSFDLDPHPSERRLRLMTLEVGYRFLRDMEKQGWQYMGRGLEMSGPRPMSEMKYARSRSVQDVGKPSEFVFDLPQLDALEESPIWRYYLTGLFLRKEIPIEIGGKNGSSDE